MSSGGLEDEPVPFYVLAKLVDGSTPESLTVTLDGFPSGTTFSHGEFANSQLTIQSTDFGFINASFPEDFAGNVGISARAVHVTGSTDVSRTGDFKIEIIPVFDWFQLTAIAGCYDQNASDILELDIKVELGDIDNSETFTVSIKISSSYSLSRGQPITDGLYVLNQTDIDTTLTIILPDNSTFVPFTAAVTVTVTDIAKPGISITRSVETVVELCQGWYLTHKAPNTTIAKFANTVDPDEKAHNELSDQDLQCLLSSL